MRKVTAVVDDGVELFGLGVLVEVWAEPYHEQDDNPTFEFAVCGPRAGAVQSAVGVSLSVEHTWDHIRDADIVALTSKREYAVESPALSERLRDAADRGATVIASCSGVFSLGFAGLLDGRRCTTHWRYADQLQSLFPRAQVDADVLYVAEANVVTGAGSAAGIDANLHLMRELYGAQTANSAARRIVVPPHRDGGQAQFISTAVRDVEAETLGEVLQWAAGNLAADLSVKRLAAKAHMSDRTFARRFRAETGTTPLQWVTSQRVHLAAELLESSRLSIEEIAHQTGFGNSTAMRHHFTQIQGTSPQLYRRQFQGIC